MTSRFDQNAVNVEFATESDIRATLERRGYRIMDRAFSTGRPDRVTFALEDLSGIPLVAKQYPAGKGERVYQNMLALWNSSFGRKRQPPGLPRPIEFLPQEGVLITERIDGSPLSELGSENEPLLPIMRLLVDLHQSGTIASTHRGP